MKSIILEDDVHAQLKNYCDDKGFKISKLVSTLILNHIENENCKMSDMRSRNEGPDKRKSSEEIA